MNTKKWGIYEAPPRVKQADHVAGGELKIIGAIRNGKDTTGGIQSSFGQKYGRWEVRFRADKGAGYSAVVLLWPSGGNPWPSDGEIDIMEVGNPTRQSGSSWLHNGIPEHKKSGPSQHVDFSRWHTVAVEWLPKSITFFLDGKKTFRTTNKNLIPTTQPMHVALQFDKCDGYWVKCRTKKTKRWMVMHVDWVKAYALPR
ncbi:MAG: glycoside hydrolase family 16 protein [Streptosporangiaceae bacterium]